MFKVLGIEGRYRGKREVKVRVGVALQVLGWRNMGGALNSMRF